MEKWLIHMKNLDTAPALLVLLIARLTSAGVSTQLFAYPKYWIFKDEIVQQTKWKIFGR